MKFSIIVPVLNEAAVLPAVLGRLLPLVRRGCEVIVVDGGSTDGSEHIVQSLGFKMLRSERGRARQMNTGAACATGDVFIFVHADTHLPLGAIDLIRQALSAQSRCWGRFDVFITGQAQMLRAIGRMMNWRSRLSGIATGDQAIFITKQAFQRVGGFPDQPLMEDIELSKRLRKIVRPVCISRRVTTSGRRWESYGVWRTIFLMWRLRWQYWRGVSAHQLAKAYK